MPLGISLAMVLLPLSTSHGSKCLAKIKEWEEDSLSQHFQAIHFVKNKWEVGRILEATLLTPLNIPNLGYGQIYPLFLGLLKNRKQYEVTIDDYLACNCMDFSSTMVLSMGKQSCGCLVSTCIKFCNMPCIMGLGNHSSTIHPIAKMRFINSYIVPKSWK